MNFFKVKVQFEEDNSTSKVQKTKHVNRMYIVNAVSPTEAEIKVTKALQTVVDPFVIKDCVCTNYVEYIP